MHILFCISRGKLVITHDNGASYEIDASSGNGGCMNNASDACQNARFEGPVPEGQYLIDPDDISDPGTIRDFLRRTTGDWGDWRVRIRPSGATNTRGRSGFFLHGGDTPGTRGCIDIGGGISGNTLTHRLKKDISATKGNIRLEVRR